MSVTERTYPPCTGGEPPACCQPPRAERTARLEAAQAAVEAVTPKWCPHCGSRDIVPTFPPDPPLWECGTCGPFSGRD